MRRRVHTWATISRATPRSLGARSGMLHANPRHPGLGSLGRPPPAGGSPPSRRAVARRRAAWGPEASVAVIFSPWCGVAGRRIQGAKSSRLLRLLRCRLRRRGPPGPRRLTRSEGTRKGSLDRGRAIPSSLIPSMDERGGDADKKSRALLGDSPNGPDGYGRRHPPASAGGFWVFVRHRQITGPQNHRTKSPSWQREGDANHRPGRRWAIRPAARQPPFTAAISSRTFSTGVCGSTPWPRLKMWPGRPPARASTSRARRRTVSRSASSTTGSRLPCTARS